MLLEELDDLADFLIAVLRAMSRTSSVCTMMRSDTPIVATSRSGLYTMTPVVSRPICCPSAILPA